MYESDTINTKYRAEEGNPSNVRIIYIDGHDGKKYKGKIYYRYENKTCYLFTYTAVPVNYESDLPLFEMAYSTLKFE
jgi:hypothetical protein